MRSASSLGAVFLLSIFAAGTAAAQTYSLRQAAPTGWSVWPSTSRQVTSKGHVVGIAEQTGTITRTNFYFDGTSFIDLGPAGSGHAAVINERDEVGGGMWIGDYSMPFLWRLGSEPRILSGLPAQSYAGISDMNSAGISVGSWGYARSFGSSGFRWNEDSGYTLIPGGPIRINEAGQVIGIWHYGPGDEDRAYYWDEASGYTQLMSLTYPSRPLDINDAGTVLLETRTSPTAYRLVLWSRAGGFVETNVTSTRRFGFGAARINSAGQVGATRLSPQVRALIWSLQGGLTELSLDGRTSSFVDMNDSGDVVGLMDADSFGYGGTPFVYRNGHLELLDSVLPADAVGTIAQPFAIKNTGVIAATTVDNELAILTPSNAPPPAFRFTGFQGSIENPPAVNVTKAGSTSAVKFALGGDYGLDILAPTYPRSASSSCSDAWETSFSDGSTATAGHSGLSYDAETGRYSYAWKTDKAWAGSCRVLLLRFVDGTEGRALFRFR